MTTVANISIRNPLSIRPSTNPLHLRCYSKPQWCLRSMQSMALLFAMHTRGPTANWLVLLRSLTSVADNHLYHRANYLEPQGIACGRMWWDAVGCGGIQWLGEGGGLVRWDGQIVSCGPHKGGMEYNEAPHHGKGWRAVARGGEGKLRKTLESDECVRRMPSYKAYDSS